jgi:hypothetical protein
MKLNLAYEEDISFAKFRPNNWTPSPPTPQDLMAG